MLVKGAPGVTGAPTSSRSSYLGDVYNSHSPMVDWYLIECIKIRAHVFNWTGFLSKIRLRFICQWSFREARTCSGKITYTNMKRTRTDTYQVQAQNGHIDLDCKQSSRWKNKIAFVFYRAMFSISDQLLINWIGHLYSYRRRTVG